MQPLPRDSVIVFELLDSEPLDPVDPIVPLAVLLEELGELAEDPGELLDEPGVLPVTPDELALDPRELLPIAALLLPDDPEEPRPLVLATPPPAVASAEIITVMPGCSVIERMSAEALDEPAVEELLPEGALLAVLEPLPGFEPALDVLEPLEPSALEPLVELPLAAPSPLAVEPVITMWHGALALELLVELGLPVVELGLLLLELDWAIARPAAIETESAPNAIELKRCLMLISC